MPPQPPPLTAAQLPAARELILLWTMITTGIEKFDPSAVANTSDSILDAIQVDYIAKTGNHTWNWTNLTRTLAKAVVDQAIGGGNADNYGDVGEDFQRNIPAAAGATASTPWTTDGHDHPSVADVIDALSLT